MRKLTYEQAATCGENLKIMVTPEQSEKIQKAWFAAGKTWKGGDRKTACLQSKYIFLYSDGTLASRDDDYWFNNHDNEEIELIDDIAEYTIDELINTPQTDFANQQEMWLWLSSGNGNMVKCENNIVGFKDNKLFSFSHNSYCDFYFKNYQNWQKYTPPKLIRVNGIEVPAPLDCLDGMDVGFLVSTSLDCGVDRLDLDVISKSYLNKKLKAGLLYEKYDDAVKRYDAMMIFEVIK